MNEIPFGAAAASRVRADWATWLSGLVDRGLETVAVPGGIAVAYYVGCLAGFALRYPSSGISFLWPPNAILLTALLVVGRRHWPMLAVGTLVAHGLAHAQNGVPVPAWFVQFLGNASQAALAAWLLHRFGAVAVHQNFRTSLVFVVAACIVAPAVASVGPAHVYMTLGWTTGLFEAWRARTVSNGIATLALVPTLLAVCRFWDQKPNVQARSVVEFLGLLGGLAVTYRVAAAINRDDLLGLSLLLSATTPFLIWAAVRFGGAGLSCALSAALLMMSNTVVHVAPVAPVVPAEAIVGVQMLLAATAIPLSLLAGLLQQRLAEHQLLVNVEHENRAILRAMPDTILLHTKQGGILRSYARHEPVTAAKPVPGAIAPAVIARAVTRSPTEADEPHVIEYTEGANDTARRYEARSAEVDSARTVTIIRDITHAWRSQHALIDAQLRYRLAQGVVGVGQWDYDVATGHFGVDGPLKTVLGYGDDDISDALSDWQRVVFEQDREDVLARLSALVTGASPALEIEFRVSRKDGSLRWIASRGAVTQTEGGKPSRVVGVYLDITAHKESERALTDANDRLARLGRIAAMSELTASLAHELHQPLAAINANVEACLRGVDAQQQRALYDALDDVRHDSRRASKIIERTSQLFQNRHTERALHSLNDIVRDVARIAAPRLRELHVRMRLALDPAIPHVHLDEVQLQQVVFNLVVNAAEAVHAVDLKRREVQLATRGTRRYVVVSVRDSGEGVDPAGRGRMFEPFYTTKAAGTGMGLAISRSIVGNHGGTLWAVANRNGGATFRFKIPLGAGPSACDANGPGTRRVLVVDDNRSMRRSLTRLLRVSGYQVAVASTGARAVAQTQTFRPDALVIDMSLGDMTGLDLAKRLRAVPAHRPVRLVALTAHEDAAVRDACIAAGFDAYLVKQTQISELPRVLQSRAR